MTSLSQHSVVHTYTNRYSSLATIATLIEIGMSNPCLRIHSISVLTCDIHSDSVRALVWRMHLSGSELRRSLPLDSELRRRGKGGGRVSGPLSLGVESGGASPPALHPAQGDLSWQSDDAGRHCHVVQEFLCIIRPFQVLFNKEDNGQLVCTGRSEVAFVEWSRGSYKSSVQSASGQDFNRAVGEFTLSQFVPRSPNVLTLTSEGNILVWTSPSQEGGGLKRVLKLYQHQEGIPLTCVQSLSDYLVLGNARGEVSFLDAELKLTQWKEKVASGPINSISFALPVSARKLHKHLVPKETTIHQSKFLVPSFMAG